MILIEVYDIFDEIICENKRLLNELLFADKCLNQLKTHLINIHSKYETIIAFEDKLEFNQLTDDLQTNERNEEIIKQSVNDMKNEEKCFQLKNFHLNDRNELKIAKQLKRKKSLVLRQKCFDFHTNSYNCPKKGCNKSFNTYTCFYDHFWHIHKTPDIVCRFQNCNKVFKTTRRLKLHQSIHRDDNPFHCQQCGHKFKTKSSLKEHTFRHTTVRRFECQFEGCDKAFKTNDVLKSHQTVHKSGTIGCPSEGCLKIFKTKTSLNLHSTQHKSEPTIRCRQEGCDQRFYAMHQLVRHKAVVHKKVYKKSAKKVYPCDWPGCDYGNTLFKLRIHKHIHTGEKSFVCDWPECGKRFRQMKNLKDHKNIHSNLKPHVCHWPGCNYQCSNNGNLYKHIRMSHKNQPK